MRYVDPLWDKIPESERDRILSQDRCELDDEFLGFTNIYEKLSMIIPTHFNVIDFGCYLAAQCYYFQHFKSYIGVDVVNLERFATDNTTHYVMTIQDFIREHGDKFSTDDTFAICSYVPDFQAIELVRNSFKNVFTYYPFLAPGSIYKGVKPLWTSI